MIMRLTKRSEAELLEGVQAKGSCGLQDIRLDELLLPLTKLGKPEALGGVTGLCAWSFPEHHTICFLQLKHGQATSKARQIGNRIAMEQLYAKSLI